MLDTKILKMTKKNIWNFFFILSIFIFDRFSKIAIIKFLVRRSGEALLNLSDESQLLDSNGKDIEIKSLGQGVIIAQ